MFFKHLKLILSIQEPFLKNKISIKKIINYIDLFKGLIIEKQT